MLKQMVQWLCLISILCMRSFTIVGAHQQGTIILKICDKVERSERVRGLIEAACTGQLSTAKKILAYDSFILNATHSTGVTALACAAARGHKSIVYYLLDQGAKPGIRDNAGKTALMHAVSAGHEKIVSRLIRANKESIDWRDKSGASALEMAVLGDKDAVVRVLLKAKASITQQCSQGQSLLTLAIARKSERVVPMLLKAGLSCNAPIALEAMPLGFEEEAAENRAALALGSDVGIAVNSRHDNSALIKNIAAAALLKSEISHNNVATLGVTPLMLAAGQDASAIVDTLVRYGANVHAVEVNGNTPLLVAAANNSQKTCVALIEAGAEVNVQNKYGNTALHCAAFHNYLEVVDILLAKGAKVDSKNHRGATPLMGALIAGGEKSVKRLLQAGADVHAEVVSGETTLMVALGGRVPRILHDLLFTYEFDLEKRDSSGNTILLQAIANKRVGSALALIRAGALINASNHTKKTPLLLAIAGGYSLLVDYLLKRKSIDVNCADHEGKTPLMLAAFMGNEKLITRLLHLGADAHAKDYLGNTVIRYAVENSEAISKVLLRRAHFLCLPDKLRSFGITLEEVAAYAKQRYDVVREFIQKEIIYDNESALNRIVSVIAHTVEDI